MCVHVCVCLRMGMNTGVWCICPCVCVCLCCSCMCLCMCVPVCGHVHECSMYWQPQPGSGKFNDPGVQSSHKLQGVWWLSWVLSSIPLRPVNRHGWWWGLGLGSFKTSCSLVLASWNFLCCRDEFYPKKQMPSYQENQLRAKSLTEQKT